MHAARLDIAQPGCEHRATVRAEERPSAIERWELDALDARDPAEGWREMMATRWVRSSSARSSSHARAVIDDFAHRRKRIRESATCPSYPENDRGAREVSDAERELEERWAAGGLKMIGVFSDVMVDADAKGFEGFVRQRERAPVGEERG